MVNILIRKRVIVIDGDRDIRDFYKLIIDSSSKFRVVGDYRQCDDALRQLGKTRPDIVLMDIALPGTNGIEGIQRIKECFRHIEIVVVTNKQDTETVYNAFRAGASGYLCKEVSHKEIISCIEEIARGGAPMSSKIARMVVNDFHARAHD